MIERIKPEKIVVKYTCDNCKVELTDDYNDDLPQGWYSVMIDKGNDWCFRHCCSKECVLAEVNKMLGIVNE